MAKHRAEDKIFSVTTLDDVPFGVKQLAAEHFEKNILEKIFVNREKSNIRKYGDNNNRTNFFLYVNKQFGETNSFVLFHTEKDDNNNIVGWIDFVMVSRDYRSEGLGGTLTEIAIDFLKQKDCIAIFIGLLQPMSLEGEEGFPTYGSVFKLKEWGFSEASSTRKRKTFLINGESYTQQVFVLT